MLQSTKKYLSDRRKGFAKAAGFAGGLYILVQYVAERLEDIREAETQRRIARDNLRRRFEQNQQDVSYTIMALITTLGKHVLQDMDVEALTQELQQQSRASRAQFRVETPSTAPSINTGTSPASSVAESASSPHDQDAYSDFGSASAMSNATSQSPDENGGEASLSTSGSELGTSQSWVDQFQAQSQSQLSTSGSFSLSEVSRGRGSPPENTNEGEEAAPHLSDSIASTSSALSVPSTSTSQSAGSSSPSRLNMRTKAELWKEVKILTFTRTLTVLYSVTLLSLFTHIQLNLLGRHKYYQSIVELEREERAREEMLSRASVAALFFDPLEVESRDFEEEEKQAQRDDLLSEETEVKYLTLSWWVLHVGWKDIGERVRRGVEEVFEGVSLKSKLGSMELHRLVGDVRRRVEFEVTFEGQERRINFLSSMVPPTQDTLQHVLSKSGLPSYLVSNFSKDETFSSLLSETQSILTSPDFALVLEVALGRATEILFDGLRKNVFVDSGFDGENEGTGQGELKLRLAGLLPGLARWSTLALGELPNELVDGLASLREVEVLSTIIFSKFEERCY